MRGQPQASPARSEAAGGQRHAAAIPAGPGAAHRQDVTRPLPDPVAIRLCRVPDSAPPYDDDDAGESGPVRADVFAAAITAALDAGGREARAPGSAGQPGPARRADTAAARPGGWPSKFAQVLAETLAGSRSPAQLTPWTTERARSHIRRLGPMLAAGQQPQVQRIVTSLPAAGVMEMSVVVSFGPRVRALAVRLERTKARAADPGHAGHAGHAGAQPRWLCTAVEAA